MFYVLFFSLLEMVNKVEYIIDRQTDRQTVVQNSTCRYQQRR